MSIDIDHEVAMLFPLAEVPKLCPGSKRPTVNCVYRWAKRGVNGVFLEVWPVGGALLTTESAVYSFFRALKEKREREQVTAPEPSTEREASRLDMQIERELDQAGFGDDPNDGTASKTIGRSERTRKQTTLHPGAALRKGGAA